ncbi:MAG: NADH-quinone oxidoreductase subunit C [Nitrosarchaeum sp.]|nr:NADH-quinone oxidoreductase subunit C [Nitrosarchaeum sp.]
MNHKETTKKYYLELEKFDSDLKKLESNNELHLSLNDPYQLHDLCEFLKKNFELRLLSIICSDEQKLNGKFKIRHIFGSDVDDFFLFVISSIDSSHIYFPSIYDVFPSSILYEREINDMFGLIAKENPNIKPLILHDFPNDVFPLRKNFKLNNIVQGNLKQFEFTPITGEGVCEIPVGPIHAGIIEPGHFRFSVVGETIINLETRLGYTHKGIEKLAESMPINDVVFLSERISGDESVANSVAFCQAVEKIAQLTIPKKAQQIRLLFAELERIYNHFGTMGGILADIGFPYGASRLNILKEQMMQLNEKLSGSRILFGINQIGGVKANITDEMLTCIHYVLDDAFQTFEKTFDLLKSNSSVMDRLRNTGIIEKQTARDFGLVGISSRCIGIETDARHTHPYGYYPSINLKQKTPRETMEHQVELQKQIGDVLSRFMNRVNDLRQSKNIIDSITTMENDELSIQMNGELTPYSSGLGYTESHRGETLHWVMIGEHNSIFRYKIRTASFSNWPIIEHAVLNNIVADFPVINKSFDFSYSGNDL